MRHSIIKQGRLAFKKLIVLSLAAAMLFAFAAVGQPASDSMQFNRVIAVVNGELISMYDLQQQAMPEVMRRGFTGNDSQSAQGRQAVFNEVLNNMILDILYTQEAKRYNITIADSEVENELRKIIQGNKLSAEEFEKQLALQGMTMDELRKRLRESLMRQNLLSNMVSRKAEVTDSEIKAYYEENIDKFSTQSSVEFSVIMLGPGSNPEEIYNSIQSGNISFAEAARQYSTSPTAALGGSMGNIAWRDLNPVWREALEKLDVGETTKPIDAGDTVVLLHVDALHSGSSKSLDEVAAEIEGILREGRLQARYEEYSGQLRSKAVIELKI